MVIVLVWTDVISAVLVDLTGFGSNIPIVSMVWSVILGATCVCHYCSFMRLMHVRVDESLGPLSPLLLYFGR